MLSMFCYLVSEMMGAMILVIKYPNDANRKERKEEERKGNERKGKNEKERKERKRGKVTLGGSKFINVGPLPEPTCRLT